MHLARLYCSIKKNTEKLTEVKIKCQNIDIVSYGKIDEINIDVVIGNINEGKINVPEQVLPDYEEVAEEVKNQNNTDISLENDTDVSPVLASLVYNVSFVTSDVIEQSINDSHMLMPSEDILIIMTNMLNNNTLNQISKKLQMYNKWNQNNKLAIAYFFMDLVFSHWKIFHCMQLIRMRLFQITKRYAIKINKKRKK